MAYSSYRPRRYQTEKNRKKHQEILRNEIREAQKTMRLCNICGQFNHFTFLNVDIQYLQMACPTCGEIIQVTRLINHSDEQRWG